MVRAALRWLRSVHNAKSKWFFLACFIVDIHRQLCYVFKTSRFGIAMREGERQTWGLTCTNFRRPRAKKIISHPASHVKPFLDRFVIKRRRDIPKCSKQSLDISQKVSYNPPMKSEKQGRPTLTSCNKKSGQNGNITLYICLIISYNIFSINQVTFGVSYE